VRCSRLDVGDARVTDPADPRPRPILGAPSGLSSTRVTLTAANAVAQARALIRELQRTAGTASELIDDVDLITSELVTNALMHGSPPVELVIVVDTRCLRIEICDRAPTPPKPREAKDDDENGWGLAIVAALATRCSTPADAGKMVWAEVGGDARLDMSRVQLPQFPPRGPRGGHHQRLVVPRARSFAHLQNLTRSDRKTRPTRASGHARFRQQDAPRSRLQGQAARLKAHVRRGLLVTEPQAEGCGSRSTMR